MLFERRRYETNECKDAVKYGLVLGWCFSLGRGYVLLGLVPGSVYHSFGSSTSLYIIGNKHTSFLSMETDNDKQA